MDGAVNLVLLGVLTVGFFSRERARLGASLVFAALTPFAFLSLWARPEPS